MLFAVPRGGTIHVFEGQLGIRTFVGWAGRINPMIASKRILCDDQGVTTTAAAKKGGTTTTLFVRAKSVRSGRNAVLLPTTRNVSNWLLRTVPCQNRKILAYQQAGFQDAKTISATESVWNPYVRRIIPVVALHTDHNAWN